MAGAVTRGPLRVGDRVRVSALGRRATGRVQRVGSQTAAVVVEGDGTWLVVKDSLAVEVPPTTAWFGKQGCQQ